MRTPISRIASSSAIVPPRLADQYWAGSATDSPTSDFAAKCRTASIAVGQHLGGAVAQRALDERGPGRHRVGVPGGQVVEHGDLMPGRDQLRGDDAADVPGAAGDEHSHKASLSLCAASSGTMSLIHTPIPDSVPARYFSLPGARRIDST